MATAPRSPLSLSSTEFVEHPPPLPNKIPGYATAINAPYFMESEGLLPCFQELAICSHANPAEATLHRPTVFLADAFQCYHLHNVGLVMAHTVRRRPFTAQARVKSQARLYGIRAGEGGTETDISQSPSIVPCGYHSTNAL